MSYSPLQVRHALKDGRLELLVGVARVAGGAPEIAGQIGAGNAGGVLMLVDAADVDRAGLALGHVEHLAAGRVAARAHIAAIAGRAIRATDGEAQYLALLLLAEPLEHEPV